MANEQKADELADLALAYWLEAEAPDKHDMFLLFHLLAERNELGLRELIANMKEEQARF